MSPDTFDESRLTPDALADYHEFEDCHGDGGCSCHISPPCGWCTHPGNPDNLMESDDAWLPEPDAGEALMESIRRAAGRSR